MIPIKIVSPKKLKVLWQITTACTYTCSYCPKELHTGKSTNIDLEYLKVFLDKFSDREFTINFTGGEPTIHPQFLDVLKIIKERNIKVISDSNLSRTSRFYREASEFVDNWCISIHPSMFTWDEEKIKTVADNSYTVVYLMMDPNHWDLALAYLERLKNIPRIKIIVVKCLSNWSGSEWVGSYTDEQQQFFNTVKTIYTFTDQEIKEIQTNYSWLQDQASTIYWDNGDHAMLEPEGLMNVGKHNFKNWVCSVGEEVVVINSVCDISLGTCGTRHLGNWKNFDVQESRKPIICPREYCHCGVDIKASKYK